MEIESISSSLLSCKPIMSYSFNKSINSGQISLDFNPHTFKDRNFSCLFTTVAELQLLRFSFSE